MTSTVNSLRFLDGMTKRLVKSWIKMESPRDIPWTPLGKPLSECTVALLSSAGLALKTDEPFDQDGERRNPWWGDPSHRLIPHTATGDQVGLYHLHVDEGIVEQDLNCLLPLQRLTEMAATGEIGASAPSHYSVMGYILRPQDDLLPKTVPAIIKHLQEEAVDVLVLVPA